MKNREITKDEINRITAHRLCPIREKAFFTVMRQSGLTPHAVKQLKIKNVEKILEPDTPAPCRISIPHEKYPTFIGQEAINYLQRYLGNRARRTKLTPESLLFTIRNNPNKEINTKDVSRTFKLIVQDLARNGKITFEIRRGKPSELRLYSLVNSYRKNASDYLAELHLNNTPKGDEFYRNLYEKLAMPFLEIEPPSPMAMHQLRKQLVKIEDLLPKEIEDEYGEWLEEHPEEYEQIEKQHKKDVEDDEKWRKEHPDEAKRIDQQMEKEIEESQEQTERFYTEYLEDRVKELEKRLKEVEDIVKKPRKTKRREIRK